MSIAPRELLGFVLAIAPCAAFGAVLDASPRIDSIAERSEPEESDSERSSPECSVPECSVNGAAQASPVTLESKLEQADALLKQFDETDKLEPLQAASALLDEVAKTSPQNYGVRWRRARMDQVLGGVSSLEAEKLMLFERAINSAKAAVQLRPDAVEGHYWLGTSFGCYGEVKGMMKALSSVSDIRDEMQAVIKIDPKYEDAGAYLVLGKIDFELPGLLGGNSKRAIEEYEQGLKLAPTNALMKLYLSDSYYDAGRKDDAKRLLEEIIALKLGEHSTRDARQAQREAKQSYEKHFAKKRSRDNY